MTDHDFGDGNGPVPAHQHPNGGGWVADTAHVDETAQVGRAARVFGSARVYDTVWIRGAAQICGTARVSARAQIYGAAVIQGGWVADDARISGNAVVTAGARVSGRAQVFGNAVLTGSVVGGDARVCGDARLHSFAHVGGQTRIAGDADIWGGDFWTVDALGPERDALTVYRTKDGWQAATWGFVGTLDDLERAVAAECGARSVYARQYAAARRFAERMIALYRRSRRERLKEEKEAWPRD